MHHRVFNLTGKPSLFQNLLEKPEEKKNEAALSMIQCKLLPVLSVLNGKTWVDEDIKVCGSLKF